MGWVAAVVLLVVGAQAHALGPHEVMLLVNGNSPRSIEVANRYIHMRGIPPANVIFLSIPDSVLESTAEMSPADFTRWVWEPANKAMDERRIRDHIMAWIYSVDFPVRITTDPPVSLQGITFVRNHMPPSEDIAKGKYRSPLFRGPDAQDGPVGGTLSLEQFAVALGADMPLPSMMLGYTGARGLTVDQVTDCLRRGVAADYSAPQSGVYFLVTDDVRSRCRHWQFPAAVEELKTLGVPAAIVSNAPGPTVSVVGCLAGVMALDPSVFGKFVPGAIGEHLTSFGAYFHDPKMTVLTEWIRAGATVSDGTVTEPMAIWTKFPNGRIFAHYARGCTALESYFQSIRCPLQLLIVGDPLVRPWARRASMVVVRVDDESVPGKAAFHTDLLPPPESPPEFIFMVDGKSIGGGAKPDIVIPPGLLSDGYHELQAVAYLQGTVRHQVAASCGFTVNPTNRQARLEGISEGAKVDLHHPFKVKVVADGKPVRLAVVSGVRVVAEGADAVVNPRVLGKGPVSLQAVAIYEGGESVRGEPVALDVQSLNVPPVIESVTWKTNAQNRMAAAARVSDPEGDAVSLAWFQRIAESKGEVSGGRLDRDGDAWKFSSSTSLFDTAFFPDVPMESVEEIEASISIPKNGSIVPLLTQKAGLIFDGKDGRNFKYFGISGESSSWVVGECRDGQLSVGASRGAYIQPGKFYRISVRKAGRDIECRVDGEVILRTESAGFGQGSLGVIASGQPVVFARMAVSPPVLPRGVFEVSSGGGLSVTVPSPAGMSAILRASDGADLSEKVVEIP
jgi:uncharacterized protein (TIGR03790 family)